MRDHITIAKEGRSWAVKHKGGYLGYAESEDEASRIARSLREWIDEDTGQQPRPQFADDRVSHWTASSA